MGGASRCPGLGNVPRWGTRNRILTAKRSTFDVAPSDDITHFPHQPGLL